MTFVATRKNSCCRLPWTDVYRKASRWLRALGLAMPLLGLALPAAAQQAPAPASTPEAAAASQGVPWPRRPFFAIDSKAHSDEWGQLVLTPDDRRAVTASFDGTLRVWDVQTGELLQRFFLPRDGVLSARLRAFAMAPDGERVVVGGYGFRNTLAIVSLRTGRIERTLGSAPRLEAAAWSPDGRYIAFGSAARAVRIYDAKTGAPLFGDTDFADPVTSVQFGPDNRLLASTWRPGRPTVVKVYSTDGSAWRVAARSVASYEQYRLAWDVEGKTVLAGLQARLDGQNLRELPFAPSRRGLPNGVNFHRAIQSPDARYLFGATYSNLGDAVGYIRRWSGTGSGDAWSEVRLPDARINEIAVTRAGEVVYMSESGVVGMVDRDLKLAWRHAHDVADLEGRPAALQVTASGKVALPVNTAAGGRDIAFNLATPEFLPMAGVQETWTRPATSGAGMRVLAWEGTSTGTVNDRRFPFVAEPERTLCVAVHSSDNSMAMGTTLERLYRVSAEAKPLWIRNLGSDVTAVNLIEGRDLVVAATANGMLWVLRWSTGEPVITYYLQPSSRRWIAFTPFGYYEAGAGSEDVAGWVVNSTEQRVADFVPLSRFRGKLLLTGLGSAAWEARSEALALKGLLALQTPTAPEPAASAPAPVQVAQTLPAVAALASAAVAVRVDELPPLIEVLSPGYQTRTDSQQVRIRIRLVTPASAPVTRVQTLVASAASATRGLASITGEAGERELVIDIPPDDTEIRLVAENRFGASAPTVIRVSYTGIRPQPGKGNLYLLAVGVSAYDNPQYNLPLAAKDSRDFVAVMRRQQGALYNAVHVRHLVDGGASKAEVEAGFAWLKENMSARDTAIVFLAGHGLNEDKAYYFLTRDVDLARLAQTAVPFHAIRAGLTNLPGRALIFVDTCHAGNVVGPALARAARDSTIAINDLASSENGLVVFAASTGSQLSQESPQWGNGAFTKAVVEGLSGGADFNKRGRVTYKGLDAYVSDRVEELTKGQQTPVTPVLQGVPDFALALLVR